MGGIQSLSRSTYSKLIPQKTMDTTSYFSFYDVSEKIGIVIGMFTYGFISQATGSIRHSILFFFIFFILVIILLFMSNLSCYFIFGIKLKWILCYEAIAVVLLC